MLGDLVGKGPRPAEVLDWAQQYASRAVQGNWDARVAGASHRPQDVWPRSLLTPQQLSYLQHLPLAFEETIAGKRWRFTHASSKGPFHRLYPHSSLHEQLATFEAYGHLGLTQAADAVVFGDIHEVLLLDVMGKPLYNCGSVGNPLDSTLPSYLLLEWDTGPAYSATFVRLDYDRAAEIAVAEASGMPFIREYVTELQTGAYQKRRKGKG